MTRDAIMVDELLVFTLRQGMSLMRSSFVVLTSGSSMFYLLFSPISGTWAYLVSWPARHGTQRSWSRHRTPRKSWRWWGQLCSTQLQEENIKQSTQSGPKLPPAILCLAVLSARAKKQLLIWSNWVIQEKDIVNLLASRTHYSNVSPFVGTSNTWVQSKISQQQLDRLGLNLVETFMVLRVRLLMILVKPWPFL